MARISFSERPKRVYYSYLSDGHIYRIDSKRPDVKPDGGGFWSCYFECEPYYKDNDRKTYILYKNCGTEEAPVFKALGYSSFNDGSKYYYTKNGVEFTEYSGAVYYSRNGKMSYAMPNSSAELPQVLYNASDDKSYTVYFDKLIECGATYDKTSKKFIPIDVTGDAKSTTYGSILMDMVKNSVSINAFDRCVAEIPEYLKGGDISKSYKIESIEYSIPAGYFLMFGELFVEKLNSAMIDKGNAIVGKYVGKEYGSAYQNVAFSSTVTPHTGSQGPIGMVRSTVN